MMNNFDDEWIKKVNFEFPSKINDKPFIHFARTFISPLYKYIDYDINNLDKKIMTKHTFENKEDIINNGKWMLFIDNESIDNFWYKVCRSYCEDKLIGVDSMKVATMYENPRASKKNVKVICLLI